MDDNELIERAERETGQRVDDNDGNNNAMALLFGAVARAMGKSNHNERDDFAAGVVIRHRMTPEYKQEQKTSRLMAKMLAAGLSPDELKDILG